jgi:hypothetical protein
MQSQFSEFPRFAESAQEVLSDVCQVSQFHQIVIECRLVLCQKHQFNLAARQTAAAVLGAKPAFQKLGESSNGDRRSKANPVTLPRVQS